MADRQTNQTTDRTDRLGHREITLPIIAGERDGYWRLQRPPTGFCPAQQPGLSRTGATTLNTTYIYASFLGTSL